MAGGHHVLEEVAIQSDDVDPARRKSENFNLGHDDDSDDHLEPSVHGKNGEEKSRCRSHLSSNTKMT